MGEIFGYSLASALPLALMYLAYKWVLAGENQHKYNRAVLMGVYSVALMFPFVCPAFAGMFQNAHEAMAATVDVAMPIVSGVAEGVSQDFTIADALLWVYLTGMSVAAFMTVVTAIRLVRLVSSGERHVIGTYVLVVTDNEGVAPFSWWRYVVMSREDYDESGDVVLLHELRHLCGHHWVDLLFAQLVVVLQWFNPAAWLMREELKTVHEYQADEAVMRSGADVRQYQMLLIKKAVGARFPSLANSLNHSKLQKRITMMYQSKSRTAGKLGSLVLVPALAIGIAVVSIPAVASVISGASETTLLDSDSKVSKISAISANTESVAEMRTSAPASYNKVFTTVEKLAEFPGGIEAMMKWLQYNVKYPKEAEKAGEQGKAVVKFTVNKDGSISNATIIKSVSPSIDKEALRVVTSMPKWKPAENGGKKVACWYTLPVSFRLAPDKVTTKK